jgi:hypothetical protein
LSTDIVKKKRLTDDKILGLHYDPQSYGFLMADVGRLYREANQEISTTALNLFKGSKIQLSSLESVRTFRTVEDHDVRCTGNSAVYQEALEDNYVFRVHEDTTLEVIHHMLKSGRKSGTKVRKSEDCDGREKSSRRRLALRTTCASGPVMRNGPSASEGGDNVQVAK